MVKYADLLKGVNYVSPNTIAIGNTNLRIRNQSKPIYYAGTKIIRFIAHVESDRYAPWRSYIYRRPSEYSVEIDFKGVGETDGLNPMEIRQKHLPRPSLSKNDIMIRCTCLNYNFRVDFANRRVRAAVGSRPPVYHSKSGEHLNNDTPTICKHVISYVNWLLANNFIME